MSKKKNVYTVRKKRKFLLPAAIVLFFSIMFVAIISLLPNRGTYLGNTNTLGVGRSALYPFAFVDENNTLYVLKENNDLSIVDDSVYSALHDYDGGSVYYLRNNKLYSYSIEKNSRTELCTDVAEFKLMSDRQTIVCTSVDKNIRLYKFSTGKYTGLTQNPFAEISFSNENAVGKNHVLFLDNYDPMSEKRTVDLMISTESGAVTRIAEKIDPTQGFYLSEDDKYVLYYTDKTMHVCDAEGKDVFSIEGGKILKFTQQPVLLDPKTNYVSLTEETPFTYFTKETDSGIELYHFKSGKLNKIDDGIVKIVENSSTGYCFYTKTSDTSTEEEPAVDLMMSVSGTESRKIITLPAESNYIYDELQGYIYFQKPDATLSRIYVKNRSYKVIDVAQTSGALSIYKNRPFIVYKSPEDSDTFVVLDNNIVERYSENETRLYGSSTNEYLIFKKNTQGTQVVSGMTSLDLYNNGNYTRIANSVINDLIYFDKDFTSVLYLTNGRMYEWKDGVSTEIKSTTNLMYVKPVSVTE
ncbi:MAG: hypothetical protein II748_04880 [Clostridia bacterium]|nr:hypothetical protein [Clostridia bacterium]